MPMNDLPCNTGYPLWKPPSNYFPHGEAPPPYEAPPAYAEQSLLCLNQNTISNLNFHNASHQSIDHDNHSNNESSQTPTSQNNNASSSPLISDAISATSDDHSQLAQRTTQSHVESLHQQEENLICQHTHIFVEPSTNENFSHECNFASNDKDSCTCNNTLPAINNDDTDDYRNESTVSHQILPKNVRSRSKYV